jgi:hypothetical protein
VDDWDLINAFRADGLQAAFADAVDSGDRERMRSVVFANEASRTGLLDAACEFSAATAMGEDVENGKYANGKYATIQEFGGAMQKLMQQFRP